MAFLTKIHPRMIQKLNIGTTLAALALFFLPWIDIQCSGKSFATQTGIQTIYGGGSPSPEMKRFVDEKRQAKSSGDESMGNSGLVAIALIAVIGAVVASFVGLRSNKGPKVEMVGMLCTVALTLIVVQMMVGFPVAREMGEKLAETPKNINTTDPMEGAGAGIAAAMMMNIQVRHAPALYIELIMLGLPTLVFANGLIDKMKKAQD